MTWDDRSLLRLYIDDQLDGNERFDDLKLDDFLTQAGGDVHLAAARIWAIKAATVFDWYFSQTDGSILNREQVFDHCMAMAKYHEGRSSGEIISVAMDSGGGGSSTSKSWEF